MDTVHFDVSPWWLVLLLSLDFQLTGINASTNPYENFSLTQTSPSESKQAFAGENVLLLLLSQCSLMFPLQVEGASTNAPRW